MITRRFNDKLLLWTIGVAVLLGVSVHFLHGALVRRHAGTLLAEVKEAEEESRLDRAASRLSRYLVLASDDVEELAHYAAILDASAVTTNSRWRVIGVLRQVLVREPSRQDVRRRLVARAMELSAFSEARKHLEVLVRSNTGDRGLEVLLGQCLEAEGDFDRAATAYEEAIRHAPQETDAYLRLAGLFVDRLNQPLKAGEVMDRLVEANLASAQAYLARGGFRLRSGLLDVAAADLAKARELSPLDADVLAANAVLAEMNGETKRACNFWCDVAAVRPKDPIAYLRAATLFWQEGTRDSKQQAMLTLDIGLGKLPGDPELLRALAELHIAQNDRTEALKIIAQLRKEALTRPLADYLQGRLLMHERKLGQAIQSLESVANTSGIQAELAARAWESLGQAFDQLGDRDRQLTAYEKAVQFNPASVSARMCYAAALSGVGRIDDSLEHYGYLANLPGAPPSRWTALARVLIQKNLQRPLARRDWREVDRTLDRAAHAPAKAAHVTVLRAEALAAQGQPNQAREVLANVSGPASDELAVVIGRAELAARQGNRDEARDLWKMVVERKRVDELLACVEFWGRWGGIGSRALLAELETAANDLADRDQLRLLQALAQAHHRLGHYADAERLANLLATRDSSDLASRIMLVDLALAAGRAEAVEPLLPDLRRLEGPEGTWRRYAQAALLVLRGDKVSREEARRLLADLVHLRPGWPRLALLEARLDELDGNPSRAMDDYVKAIQLGDLRPDFVYSVSQLLANGGRYQDADDAIRRLQQQATLGRDFARHVADIALRAGNSERALTLARQAVAADERDHREYLWLGEMLAATGRRNEAEQAFRRAVELARHAPDAWVALTAFQARTDQLEKAEATMAEAERTLSPETAPLAMAECEEALGRWSRAEERYRRALANRPEDFLVLQRMARYYLRLQQPREAAPLLRKLLDPAIYVSEQDQSWARRQLALVLVERENEWAYQEALSLLDRNRLAGIAESLADQRARALILATGAAGRVQALRTLTETAAWRTATPVEQFFLARLYEETNDWPAAREQMLSLLAMDKQNPAYLAQYIRWLLERNQREEASLWLARLEKAAPDDPRTSALRKQLP
jgi:tetratricopeptide (TPR) repeat protein